MRLPPPVTHGEPLPAVSTRAAPHQQVKAMDSFPEGFQSIVIGATGGIGQALVAQLEATHGAGRVVGLGRRTTPALNLRDEATIADAASALTDTGPYDLIIDATGVLDGQGAFPEKSLRTVTAESLHHAMALNAIGPALLLKHFHALLPRKARGVFATLSARVGSIGDNRLGGWYGYRASKAALNQLMRTASIEIQRRRKLAVCLALHPGTVHTALSANFVASDKPGVFTPPQSARKLLQVIDQSTPEHNGGFFAYDHTPIEF